MSVKVVNDVRNLRPYMRRKDAAYYVDTGRAEWITQDQTIRLVLTDSKNKAAAARARAWEQEYKPSFDGDRITEKLLVHGVNPPSRPGRAPGLAAVDHSTSHRQKPKSPVDHLIGPRMDAEQAQAETQLKALQDRATRAEHNGQHGLAESLRGEAAAIRRSMRKSQERHTREGYLARESYRKAGEMRARRLEDCLFTRSKNGT